MNKPIKMLAGLMLAVTLAGAAAMAAPAVVSADAATEQSSSSSSTATHTLSNSYVVYGAGAPQSVYDQLNSVMGVDSSFKKLTATASDYAKYIGNGTTTDAAMISSVAIAPTDPGSGVKVNIKNTTVKATLLRLRLSSTQWLLRWQG